MVDNPLYTCEKCGGTGKAVGKHASTEHRGLIECTKCKNQWYINHCWKCAEEGDSTVIDSRKSGMTRCSTCGWYHCPVCDKCEPNCVDGKKRPPPSGYFERHDQGPGCDEHGREMIGPDDPEY